MVRLTTAEEDRTGYGFRFGPRSKIHLAAPPLGEKTACGRFSILDDPRTEEAAYVPGAADACGVCAEVWDRLMEKENR